MKKRIFISLLLIILLLVTVSIITLNLPPRISIVYGVIVCILVSLVLVYLFNGLVKFLVMMIYTTAIILGVVVFKDYQHAIIAVGTFAIIVNPLASLENYITQYFDEDEVSQLSISIRGSYWPYYEYRKNMKDFIRLPQTKKLFTKKWYLRLRQLTFIILLFLGLYLFLNELKNIYFDTIYYNPISFLVFYGILAIFVSSFMLVKSGFYRMFTVAIGFIFIPIIVAILLLDINFMSKMIFAASMSILGIAYIAHQKFDSLGEVAYNAYEYYDPAKKRYVYANQFYEPLVYNETYTLVSIYKLKIEQKNFEKELNDILLYANYKHFMITAYTYNGIEIEIFTDFHKRDIKKVFKFKLYLENKFNRNIELQYEFDKDKLMYESQFFHRPEYIIARASNLVDLMNELEVQKEEVIVTMIYTFKNLESINDLMKIYFVKRLESFEDKDYYVASISVRTTKNKFELEQKIRDILLNAMIYNGVYVRVLVYYEGVKE